MFSEAPNVVLTNVSPGDRLAPVAASHYYLLQCSIAIRHQSMANKWSSWMKNSVDIYHVYRMANIFPRSSQEDDDCAPWFSYINIDIQGLYFIYARCTNSFTIARYAAKAHSTTGFSLEIPTISDIIWTINFVWRQGPILHLWVHILNLANLALIFILIQTPTPIR